MADEALQNSSNSEDGSPVKIEMDIASTSDRIEIEKKDRGEFARQKSKSTANIEDIIRAKSDVTHSCTPPSKNLFVGGGGGDDESFNIDAKIQYSGYLYKHPFGHKSKRWQRRFFVIKEGFLLYYSEAEGRTFEKSNLFNIHPKGVIPLGGCTVNKMEVPGHRNSIAIGHDNFYGGAVMVAASDKKSQDMWVESLEESSRVTWKNSALGAKMVQEFTHQTQELIEDKQKFIEKLDREVETLAGERESKKEMEELSKRLSEEKTKLEEQARHFRTEKDVTEAELEEAMTRVKSLNTERSQLNEDREKMHGMMEQLQQEKEESEKELQKNVELSKVLVTEKDELVKRTELLNQDLTELEAHSQAISEGKRKMERELSLHVQEASKLQSEADTYRKQYSQLETHIKGLSDDKLRAETRYISEHKSRIMSDKRLRQAEGAVKRLDRALKDRGINIDLELDTDIKGLIGFFEEVIEEATFEMQKLEIMKSAVTARQEYELTTTNSVDASASIDTN